MEEDQPRTVFRLIMGGFGLAVCVAGLCCIGLQEGWGKSMSPSQKVPETHRRPRFHSDEHVASFLPFPIVLRRNPLRHSASHLVAQVPIYFLLGTTLSFSVIFGFGEIVNMGMAHFTVTTCPTLLYVPRLGVTCWRALQGEDAAPIFNSTRQIALLVTLASIMGAIEGIIFGSLDAEVGRIVHAVRFTTRSDLVRSVCGGGGCGSAG